MISIATTLRRVTASACSISCRRKSYATFRLGSYPSGKATRRVTEKRCGPDGETGPHHESRVKASHTGREGFWHGSTEMSRHIAKPDHTGRTLGDMTEGRSEAEGHRRLHTRTHRRDSPTRTRSGARARRDHVRLRSPAARKETGAQDRPANPDPPANGKAPRTWCVCQWPNEVHASTLRPGQGGVCPPPSLQGASTLQQRGSDASTHTDNGDDDDTDKNDG
jgi:hypothetical protein